MKNTISLFRWDLRSKHNVDLYSYKTVKYQAVCFLCTRHYVELQGHQRPGLCPQGISL